jgi:hypothetical protein
MRLAARRQVATTAARQLAEHADDARVIEMLRRYADDLELEEGRSHAPQWMREAANRLQMHVNNGKSTTHGRAS